MDPIAAAVAWAQGTHRDRQGALGVLVLGWEAGAAEALQRLEHSLHACDVAHHVIDMHLHHLRISLAQKIRELKVDAAGGVVSIIGIRDWLGPGESPAREFGEQLERELPELLSLGHPVLLWMPPHLWATLRHLRPRLAEQWTVFDRLAPPEPERLVSEVFERWLLAIVPMRHRGHPERAQRRMDRFARQMDTFTPRVLTAEQLAWGIVIPWLRTLLDAGAYAKVVEEFRHWAPSIEPVAAAYGLAMVCSAGAEMLLGRTGSAQTTLEEAEVRLKSVGHTKGEAVACSMKGQLAATLGNLPDAELQLAMGTQVAELAEATRLVAWNCVVLAVLTLLQGHEEESHSYLEYSWVLFESDGDVSGMAVSLWADALRLWWFGNDTDAAGQNARVTRILTVVRDGPALVSCAGALAAALCRLGKEDAALRELDRARRAVREIGFADGLAALDRFTPLRPGAADRPA